MIGPRHEKASLQSDFYRQQYHRVLRWLMYMVAIIYLLIFAIFYFVFNQPAQSYYANTPDGKIMPMPTTSRN